MLTFNDKNVTYDANGNMTSVTNACGTTTYTWDVRNRLIGISGYKPDCSVLTASFQYDALGRRIEKTVNGRTIQYLYDGKDIVQEIENGAPAVNYVRTLNIDEPLARIQSTGTVRYYQADALGSITALTDKTCMFVSEVLGHQISQWCALLCELIKAFISVGRSQNPSERP
jgi:YD repeat-containing protein